MRWKNKKLLLQRALAIALALGVWQLAAMALNRSILLCSPLDVLRRLAVMLTEAHFYNVLWFSAWRIMLGFALACCAALLLAALAGRFALVESLLWPFVLSIKTIPVASFIIISLIWLNGRQLSVFISFLMVFPVIYSNILQGIKSTPTAMLELARVYRMPVWRKLRYVYLPAVKPFLLSACSVALGLSWKAGIAAEVIGIPDGSIGEMLYTSKVYFDTVELFSWTVVIVLVSQLAEKLVLKLIKLGFNAFER